MKELSIARFFSEGGAGMPWRAGDEGKAQLPIRKGQPIDGLCDNRFVFPCPGDNVSLHQTFCPKGWNMNIAVRNRLPELALWMRPISHLLLMASYIEMNRRVVPLSKRPDQGKKQGLLAAPDFNSHTSKYIRAHSFISPHRSAGLTTRHDVVY
ncbi:MAG: hypothetical protein HOJ02_02720 [Rhodospirillaceae bacterium]|nr:hypothetical protein [Rhodospirillaceae bacterium]MBT5659049.1 hypothetical protein [Rhodospirillaceae bacterium]